MVNVSRYITITLLFILALVICIAFNPGAHEVDFEIRNDIIVRLPELEPLPVQSGGLLPPQKFAVVVGADEESSVAQNCIFTLDRLGYPYEVFETLDEFFADGDATKLIIAIDTVGDKYVPNIKEFLTRGDVIFAVLPKFDSPYGELSQLVGILTIQTDYEAEGFDIYERILFGGMFRTEEWVLPCAKITLNGKCKVYANGHDPDRDKDALVIAKEDETPLIWRTYYEGGAIFVFNSPFMEDESGCGILTGVISESFGDFIYPIVNARVVILENFPYIAEPGKILNNRSVFAFMRDIIWPDLITMSRENDAIFTSFTNGNYAENPDANETISYFSREMYKAMKGEMGYVIPDDETQYWFDTQALEESLPGYRLRSYYSDSIDVPNDSRMTAVVLPSSSRDLFKWVGDNAVTLPIISSGYDDERESLKYISALSAYGMISHAVDLAEPIIGETTESEWNYYAIEIAKYFSYIFRNGKYIRAMPVSGAAEAAKNYMNLEFSVYQSESGITVNTANFVDEFSFVLRTDHEVGRVENCSVYQIEKGIYMLTSHKTTFSVFWKDV